MIVLDTNQLHALGIGQNPQMLMLRAVAVMAGHPIAVPDEVEKEYLASYERQVAEAIDRVETSDDPTWRSKLLGLVPWWFDRVGFIHGNSSLPALASAVEARRKLLRSIFRVLEAPPNAAEEGMARERSRRPPAVESSRGGRGGRDTVIWLTALAAARGRPYNVYFVAQDKGFGGPKLKRELASEAPDNLVYYDSAERLIDRLSCPAEAPLSREQIMNSDDVIDGVRAHMSDGQFNLGVLEWLPPSVQSPMRLTDELVPTPSAEELAARRVGDATLVTFRTTWTLERPYIETPVPAGVTPQKHRVRVHVPLGMVAVFEDGSFSGVRVLSGGGLMPAR